MARTHIIKAEVERVLHGVAVTGHSMIVCLFTGSGAPSYLEPMARDPIPPTGVPFDAGFPRLYQSALQQNEAIHDGAILLGRTVAGEGYQVAGWSMRMYPPSADVAARVNRGSAFNSCLAMSVLPGVDALYLRSERELMRFDDGRAEVVHIVG